VLNLENRADEAEGWFRLCGRNRPPGVSLVSTYIPRLLSAKAKVWRSLSTTDSDFERTRFPRVSFLSQYSILFFSVT
jgi:hypothetical protein